MERNRSSESKVVLYTQIDKVHRNMFGRVAFIGSVISPFQLEAGHFTSAQWWVPLSLLVRTGRRSSNWGIFQSWMFSNCILQNVREPSKSLIRWKWMHSDIFFFSEGRQEWSSLCFPVHHFPSEKISTLEGMNLHLKRTIEVWSRNMLTEFTSLQVFPIPF